MTHDLPLFAWQPPCKFIPFPMVNRIGRIRDVATKLLDKPTQRSADHYQRQVTEALDTQLQRIGLREMERDEHIGAFWQAVQDEMNRIVYRGTGSNDPRGAA